MIRPSSFVPLILSAILVQPVAAQLVRGTVVDARTGQPVRDVSVMISSPSDGSVITGTMTDENGHYVLSAPDPGTYQIVTDLIGYEGERRPLVVRGQGVDVPEIRLTQVGITMVGLEVTATRDLRSHPSSRGIPTILDRAILRNLARQETSLLAAVTEHLNVRARSSGGTPCLEYETGSPALAECRPVLVVVDGHVDAAGAARITQLSLSDLESVEIVPPGLAIEQFASRDAANGALVLWSRGRGPHAR